MVVFPLCQTSLCAFSMPAFQMSMLCSLLFPLSLFFCLGPRSLCWLAREERGSLVSLFRLTNNNNNVRIPFLSSYQCMHVFLFFSFLSASLVSKASVLVLALALYHLSGFSWQGYDLFCFFSPPYIKAEKKGEAIYNEIKKKFRITTGTNHVCRHSGRREQKNKSQMQAGTASRRKHGELVGPVLPSPFFEGTIERGYQ